MRKLSIEIEKVNMEPNRYQFIFGFENLITVFRPYDYKKVTSNSKDYQIIYSLEHMCCSIEDVLIDLEIFINTGKVHVLLNDVVGIKINGSLYCFRFLGKKKEKGTLLDKYNEIKNFTEDEKNALIKEIHKKNKVMSILDGELIPIEKLEEENLLFAIDGENFKTIGAYDNGFTTTDYSLYCMENMKIKKVNLYSKPFFNIRVALYYFWNSKNRKINKNNKPILLLNRHELEIVKDYQQLNKLVG